MNRIVLIILAFIFSLSISTYAENFDPHTGSTAPIKSSQAELNDAIAVQRDADRILPYATLSQYIYNNAASVGEWKRIDDTRADIYITVPKTGAGSTVGAKDIVIVDPISFHASAYQDGTGKIAIVFEGTNPSSINDWAANFSNVLVVPSQYNKAKEFTDKIIKKYGRTNIIITGHSLGGGLAQYAAGMLNLKAITFNAAGLWTSTLIDTLRNYKHNLLQIENIVANGGLYSDVVAKTGFPIGTVKLVRINSNLNPLTIHDIGAIVQAYENNASAIAKDKLKNNNKTPVILSFVPAKQDVELKQAVTFSYSAKASPGTRLNQVGLYRSTDEKVEGNRVTSSAINIPSSGSGFLSDTPTVPGTYYYSVHVNDTGSDPNKNWTKSGKTKIVVAAKANQTPLPNVKEVGPTSTITADDSVTFTAKTDISAGYVEIRFPDANITKPMTGSGTSWTFPVKMSGVGNRVFTVTAYDKKSGAAGIPKTGTIIVKPKAYVTSVAASKSSILINESVEFKASINGIVNPTAKVILRLDSFTKEMTQSGNVWKTTVEINEAVNGTRNYSAYVEENKVASAATQPKKIQVASKPTNPPPLPVMVRITNNPQIPATMKQKDQLTFAVNTDKPAEKVTIIFENTHAEVPLTPNASKLIWSFNYPISAAGTRPWVIEVKNSGQVTDKRSGVLNVVPTNGQPVSIINVTPLSAKHREATTFTVTGSNMPSALAFTVADCDNLRDLGGGATQHQFSCIPQVAGAKAGVAIDKATNVRRDFTVQVAAVVAPPKQLPISITNVTPLSGKVGETTTFTVTGSNMPSILAFTVADCDSNSDLGGNANQHQFSCIPRAAGSKAGVAIDKATNVRRDFTVQVAAVVAPPKQLPISITNVTPLSGKVGETATFTVTGSNMPSVLAFTVADCDSNRDFGGNANQHQFSCIPRAAGNKAGVAIDKATNVRRDFTVQVAAPPPPPVSITNVTPLSGKVGETTTFTVTGSNMPSVLAFTVADCDSNRDFGGGNASQHQFSCIPRAAGSKAGVAIDKATNARRDFTVQVAAPPPPPVSITNVSPLSGKVGVATTFTVTGSNMPSVLAFTVSDCDSNRDLGGNANQHQFSCIPRAAGNKAGVAIDKATNVRRDFTVQVAAPPPPPVSITNVTPLSGRVGVATTFTVTGSNMPSVLAFTVSDCDSNKDLGGNASQHKFSCIPRAAGNKAGVAIDKATNVRRDFIAQIAR